MVEETQEIINKKPPNSVGIKEENQKFAGMLEGLAEKQLNALMKKSLNF